jgi:ParB-like chromosome segregation protein Spo0J
VGLATSRKYNQIRASIEEVGLIEPLSVAAMDARFRPAPAARRPRAGCAGRSGLHQAAPCLIATDDESYTYNNRINRLSTIQEHFMIRRAVERGVSPERLAKALSVDISHITKKINLLEGICPEAVELFKDRQFSVELGRVIRKMKPTRQVECVELMVSRQQHDRGLRRSAAGRHAQQLARR